MTDSVAPDTTTVTESDVVNQVAAWFADAWDPDLPLLEWRRRLLESGWAVPSWPSRWHGRDLPAWADRLAHDTIRAAGGVATPLGGGMGLAAPTIVEHGSDDVRMRLLAPTITGELLWCQLFSEPGAGSDLAGLTTKAELDGDEWVVSGQKVWNTSAHHADMGMLIARTDFAARKHAGLTYFALPMHQEGVEVRPIKQMNEWSSFNEVFLSECRIPAANVVGEIGDGWRVARATLAHERTFATLRKVDFPPKPWGRTVSEADEEATDYLQTYLWYPQRGGRLDLLIERAQVMGVDEDPIVRQQIASAHAFNKANEWTAARAKAARDLGKPPGPEGSLGKLAASEVARRSHVGHTLVTRADGLVNSRSDDPDHATVVEVLTSTPAQSIAGGTDQIQRNIIGENILGLAREPSTDRDVPFRDLPRNG